MYVYMYVRTLCMYVCSGAPDGAYLSLDREIVPLSYLPMGAGGCET